MAMIGLVIMAAGIAVLYSRREWSEEFLLMKLFGYCLLGTFSFNIYGFIVPIGFVISLFLKPHKNRTVKLGAAVLGFAMMIAGLFVRM